MVDAGGHADTGTLQLAGRPETSTVKSTIASAKPSWSENQLARLSAARRLLNGPNIFNKPIGNDPAVAEHTSEPAWVLVGQIKMVLSRNISGQSLLDERGRAISDQATGVVAINRNVCGATRVENRVP